MCTDGAAAMVGRQKGFVTLVRQVVQHMNSSHCVVYREALASKRMPQTLKVVLDEAVKIVNFIKSRPLMSRILKELCKEMESAHVSLLFYTEVRWLSRDCVLARLLELRSEIIVLGLDLSFELFSRLNNHVWMQRLSFLAI